MGTVANVMLLLAPIRRRIMNLVARGIVLSSDDTKERQAIQGALLAGEVRDGLERFQQYGVTSRPKDGAELVAIFLAGNRDHGLVLAVEDRRYRLKGLEKGEVALYDDLGSVVHLKRDGVIRVVSSTRIEISTPELELDGNLRVGGDVEDASGTMAEMRETFNGHVHTENGDGGGITDPTLTPML